MPITSCGTLAIERIKVEAPMRNQPVSLVPATHIQLPSDCSWMNSAGTSPESPHRFASCEPEKAPANSSNIRRDLFRPHRRMRAQRRQNCFHPIAINIPKRNASTRPRASVRGSDRVHTSTLFRSPSRDRLSTSRSRNSSRDRSLSTPPVAQ